MFWRFGGYASISTLDTILDKPDVTLEELLNESDLIQELKQSNSKLVDFLREEPVLKKLLKYVTADKHGGDAEEKDKDDEKAEDGKGTTGISFFGKGKARSRSKSVSKKDDDGETESERNEAQRKKYAYVACEVLSSEVWSIVEALLENRDDLREFWQYLRRPAPLDPVQAGYFTKVNETLLDKKTEDMLAFFKSLDGIVPAMLQHVDCPMVMDLLLKIISLEKHEGGQGIVDWLQSQDLIPLLLGYLSPEQSSATQTSAGDFLKAIITISANATTQDQSVIGPNELTRQLVSEKCTKTLISDMLCGGNPLTVGVGIIIEVIRKNNSDYDLDNQIGPEPKTSDPIYLGTLLRQFADHVPDFMRLVRSKSAKKPDLKAAFGSRIEPLGFDRFKTCELMAELLHCSNMGLLNERGAEAEVAKRDAERERLKAEGKLATPMPPNSPGHELSHDEFGSSVDSQGFHHAGDEELNEKPEEIRRLEIQNASDEDGFEKVNAPADDLPDEVTFDDLNEKIEETAQGGLASVPPRTTSLAKDSDDMPKPLSPTKKPNLHFDPPPTQAADSPTTAGVTDSIKSLGVDEDTVMSEFGDEPSIQGAGTSDKFTNPLPTDIEVDEEGPTELEKALARPEDTPAPLFAKKESSAPSSDASAVSQDIDQSVATLQGQAASSNGEHQPFETEADGSPVVGDYLKVQFVDHQVVPTILDFFFRFPWNNFLHNVVYDVVQQVFNATLERGYNRALAFDLFEIITPKDDQTIESIGLASGKDVTDRILDGQRASDASQAEKGMRLGYMGHLTLIAEEVCKFGSRQLPEGQEHIVLDRVNRAEWVSYVEGTLAETRDKDNAVLGGVRPENAIGQRSIGLNSLSGGFSSNTANTLANAGIGGSSISPEDSLAMSAGTVGQAFEINSGASGFGEDDDEDMEDEAALRQEERSSPFSEDEQASSGADAATASSIPPPLQVPPSRARRTLAARLAQKNQNKTLEDDPDAADSTALETASMLPSEPANVDFEAQADHDEDADDVNAPSGLQITGLRTVRGMGAVSGHTSKFSGLFSSDSSSDDDGSSDSIDEDDAGRDHTAFRPEGDYEDNDSSGGSYQMRRWSQKDRRPSTTEAKERTPLDDDDDDDDFSTPTGSSAMLRGMGASFSHQADEDEDDSSDDEGLVEIRTRRTS